MLDFLKDILAKLSGRKGPDKLFASHRDYAHEAEAAAAFTEATGKLWQVNAWSRLPGISADFKLHDTAGRPVSGRTVQVGDYLLIVLPGPVPDNWVQVEALKNEEQLAEFRVRPSAAPGADATAETSHFFTDDATSTFRVERKGRRLMAFEIGLDEHINNRGPQAGDRAVENTVVAAAGWLGVQQLQWQKLTDYLTHQLELSSQ